MAWDSVPWAVGGGAQHSAEVGRVLAYAAMGSAEGIFGPGDLAVRELAVPGGSVRVAPGACAVRNRASAQTYQTYVGRLPVEDTVAIAPTDASGSRSDLVVARIEDPWLAGEPWADPVDPTVGPYIFTRVISGVPGTTTTVDELGLGYTAIALARIDIPVSTGTITQAMITDLRRVARPRTHRDLITEGWWASNTYNLTSSTFATYPPQASYAVEVPPWAVQLKVIGTYAQIQNVSANNTFGGFRVRLGTAVTETAGYDSIYNVNTYRTNLMVADRITIPAELRGTVQQLSMEAYRDASQTGYMQMDGGSAIILDYEFAEVASVT